MEQDQQESTRVQDQAPRQLSQKRARTASASSGGITAQQQVGFITKLLSSLQSQSLTKMNVGPIRSPDGEGCALMLKHMLKDQGRDDRFIPSRQLVTLYRETYIEKEKENLDKQSNYSKALKSALFRKSKPTRLFAGSQENQPNVGNFLQTILTQSGSIKDIETGGRVISTTPERILDAPQIEDDYYLNLMDWSSWGQLGICLKNKVYLYTPLKIQQLHEEDETNTLCSISFHSKDKQVAIGTLGGKIKIFDLERNTLLQTLRGHHKRVSSLSYSSVLYSGSKDTMILAHDTRDSRGVVRRFDGHMGQVCGLKQSPSGLASGSNDNMAFIWDLNSGKVRQSLRGHKAAVKALAWCPWQRNLLATGGGTIDKTMKFWNIDTGKCMDSVNTKSQVCSIIWNPTQKQLLSSHGYTDNQLCLWKFPSLTKIQQLHGHTQRVLHMSLSPDESTVCSASADETLRFWKVFKSKDSEMGFYKKGHELGDISNILR